MASKSPTPDVFSLAQLRTSGTRTVQFEVNGLPLRVELRAHDDGAVDRELGRARMGVYDGAIASLRALMLGDGAEGDEARAALEGIAQTAESVAPAVTFDPRRIVVRRILERFASWNVSDVALEFDALYDAAISTEEYGAIYARAIEAPVLGKTS